MPSWKRDVCSFRVRVRSVRDGRVRQPPGHAAWTPTDHPRRHVEDPAAFPPRRASGLGPGPLGCLLAAVRQEYSAAVLLRGCHLLRRHGALRQLRLWLLRAPPPPPEAIPHRRVAMARRVAEAEATDRGNPLPAATAAAHPLGLGRQPARQAVALRPEAHMSLPLGRPRPRAQHATPRWCYHFFCTDCKLYWTRTSGEGDGPCPRCASEARQCRHLGDFARCPYQPDGGPHDYYAAEPGRLDVSCNRCGKFLGSSDTDAAPASSDLCLRCQGITHRHRDRPSQKIMCRTCYEFPGLTCDPILLDEAEVFCPGCSEQSGALQIRCTRCQRFLLTSDTPGRPGAQVYCKECGPCR